GRPVVRAFLDASVGSTAFVLRQVLGERAVRVTPLAEDYAMDGPDVVDRLNDVAIDFARTGLGALLQPDHTTVDLVEWLGKYWFLLPGREIGSTPAASVRRGSRFSSFAGPLTART